MAEGKGRVCVTGGTGFLGSWIIKSLLENGYSVNTTIRADPERKRDVRFLTNLPGASEKLHFFNADLSNPDSFAAAIEGCVGIFHTASPIDFAVSEPEEIVTKRTVDGALGILKACVNSKTVKRFIYTSSGSAVSFNGKDKDVLDESDWSDVDLLRSVKPFGWNYAVSKTLAEKAVLEFGEQNGIDVVTLILPFIVGRFVCPKLPDSIEKALVLVLGKKEQIGVTRFHMVHVDDVARAHIYLLENSVPGGRYNCSPFIVPIEEMSQLLSAKYPEYQILTVDELKEIKGARLPDLNTKKLVDAGFEFKYTIEDMFDDAIQCCKEKGYL
ncbi:Vestitone reductase [Medicago truncatula]|uniref:Dihydroflavonol 4-reductase-like protein n=1 Tax=Medicago truncatula TaxID=3880 RepID=A2Q3W4_MEDTR|nr:vestitone reductase [Medicago truncatula]ABN08314.1 NAD-dependent epimerase/dehydratase [Medicago truncatula]AES79922.1 dihydroflavonol 4-reductase-like protein [Medicago truncatula]AFK37037.1 unknown [Medicago truncatula]RHN46758.1 Vestitone reductase [Medicago truncatula]